MKIRIRPHFRPVIIGTRGIRYRRMHVCTTKHQTICTTQTSSPVAAGWGRDLILFYVCSSYATDVRWASHILEPCLKKPCIILFTFFSLSGLQTSHKRSMLAFETLPYIAVLWGSLKNIPLCHLLDQPKIQEYRNQNVYT
jgi:hypothetical protein